MSRGGALGKISAYPSTQKTKFSHYCKFLRIANCEIFSSSNFLTKVCTVLVCSGYCSGFSVHGYFTVFRELNSLNRIKVP